MEHKLSEINEETKQAICKICGPIKFLLKNKKKICQNTCRASFEDRYNELLKISKQREIECLISFEEYMNIIKNFCVYCDGFFGKLEETKRAYFIDRADNNKGYVFDNCVACCPTCNYFKGDFFTHEEAKVGIQAIIKIRKENHSGDS